MSKLIPHFKPLNHPQCSNCSMLSFCVQSLPNSLQVEMAKLVKRSISLDKAESWQAQDATLYAVQSGVVKAFHAERDGKERIVGFYFPGEVLGFDNLHPDHEHYQLAAIKPATLCEIPLNQMLQLIAQQPELQHKLVSLMSQRMNWGAYVTHLQAEQRLAGFLLEFAKRMHCEAHFILPLTREDMGNYLGLAAETVTRLLTRFQERGLIEVENKQVKLLDKIALSQLL